MGSRGEAAPAAHLGGKIVRDVLHLQQLGRDTEEALRLVGWAGPSN